MYCPLARGECQGKDCVFYNVDAEMHCLIYAYLYRVLLKGK